MVSWYGVCTRHTGAGARSAPWSLRSPDPLPTALLTAGHGKNKSGREQEKTENVGVFSVGRMVCLSRSGEG